MDLLLFDGGVVTVLAIATITPTVPPPLLVVLIATSVVVLVLIPVVAAISSIALQQKKFQLYYAPEAQSRLTYKVFKISALIEIVALLQFVYAFVGVDQVGDLVRELH